METLSTRIATAVARRTEAGWSAAGTAEAALAALDLDAADVEREAALAELAHRFGLSPAETAILEVAALADHTVSGHLLTGLLSGDPGPARATVAVAMEVAGLTADARAAQQHLGQHSALVRQGLVATTGADVLLSRRVVLPDRVAAHLAGDDVPTRRVLGLLHDAVPVEVEGTELVAAALGAGQRLVWIHAPAGGAGAAMAAAACRRLDVAHLVADLGRLDPTTPVEEAAFEVLLEGGLAGSVVVLVGAERVRPDVYLRSAVPVVGVSAEPWDPVWPADLPLTVPAPRLSVAERQALWQPLLEDETAAREVSGMPLSPEQIVAVGRHAVTSARLHGEERVSIARVRQSARELGRGRSVRANAGSSVTLDDLVLPPAALGEVTRLLDWARYRDEVTALGPLHGKGGKGTGICALFSGPPGTGKTLAAHVVADSLGMDLYQVDLSTIVDKYIGETEKNLERVFTEAEATNAVLFFDEADALFGSRSEVRDAKDRYANQEIAYLLQRMEQFDGITVLASNLRGNIDPAFARRLHFMVAFPAPDEPTRRRLWSHHLDGIGTDAQDPVDLDGLAASVELAGGDIRNIVLTAVYAAVAEGTPLGMRHLADAVVREHVKLGRRPPVLTSGSNPRR
ncbi:AAA family ATPase [Nocardioides sp. LMS-CY]|uniref:Putative nucleic acid-binding protein n=1 Tax=Nocardioides soli TaxID=1036020 RepID=A0A7W4VSB3_9ACTN|nr:ATP-binding protein [Nocardioides sp. LMS-CY]MBB3040469.1 putative nucleic acid-binding protein [Nocardioides soli]QWF24055.1 AAA family ATPase [Nocardioides sp. LMS-CY]